MDKNLHSGHRSRLRDLAYKTEFKNLEPHQILELLLTYVIPRSDTNPLAHKLIDEFGSFSGVLDAKREDLLKIKGVGEITANFLASIKNFFFAYNESKLVNTKTIKNTNDAVNYLACVLNCKPYEEFYVLCLDNNGNVKKCELIATGTVNKASVSIRKVLETAFKYNATTIIIAHNHPSGKATPSADDDKLTKAIMLALLINNIRLIDHIVLGNHDFYSYNLNGQIHKYEHESITTLNTPMASLKDFDYNKNFKK